MAIWDVKMFGIKMTKTEKTLIINNSYDNKIFKSCIGTNANAGIMACVTATNIPQTIMSAHGSIIRIFEINEVIENPPNVLMTTGIIARFVVSASIACSFHSKNPRSFQWKKYLIGSPR